MLKKVIFLHLPKTAGSTLFNLFKGTLSPTKDVFPHHIWNTCLKHEQFNFHQYKVICGHYFYSDLDYLNNNKLEKKPYKKGDAYIATFLRDPINRVISHFNHLKAQNPAGMSKHFRFYLESPSYSMIFSRNVMTKQLGLNIDNYKHLQYYRKYAVPSDGCNFQPFLSDDFVFPQEPDGVLVNRAFARLKTFDFVGSFEKLEPDIRRLATIMGVQKPFTIPKTNQFVKYEKREKLDQGTLDIIKSQNELDIALFNMWQCESAR